MSAADFPEVADLIPHARRMLLLDRVLEHGPEHTVCAVHVDGSELFQDAEGCVPAWVGIEYLAQCMAVYGSLVARTAGRPPRLGPFIGGRRVKLRVDRFRPGQVLRVTVRHLRGDRGLVAFDGRIEDAADGASLVEGRLNVYSADLWTGRPRSAGGSSDAS
ncbi:MAG TPA: 3-hydroxylacyl-ACP dehydratase [Myxococcota bacterium]|jgi:predicted hotdog family 3-hydroxylacyl-ACP dehydratase